MVYYFPAYTVQIMQIFLHIVKIYRKICDKQVKKTLRFRRSTALFQPVLQVTIKPSILFPETLHGVLSGR